MPFPLTKIMVFRSTDDASQLDRQLGSPKSLGREWISFPGTQQKTAPTSPRTRIAPGGPPSGDPVTWRGAPPPPRGSEVTWAHGPAPSPIPRWAGGLPFAPEVAVFSWQLLVRWRRQQAGSKMALRPGTGAGGGGGGAAGAGAGAAGGGRWVWRTWPGPAPQPPERGVWRLWRFSPAPTPFAMELGCESRGVRSPRPKREVGARVPGSYFPGSGALAAAAVRGACARPRAGSRGGQGEGPLGRGDTGLGWVKEEPQRLASRSAWLCSDQTLPLQALGQDIVGEAPKNLVTETNYCFQDVCVWYYSFPL